MKTREERARYVKIVLTLVGKEFGVPDVVESESRKDPNTGAQREKLG